MRPAAWLFSWVQVLPVTYDLHSSQLTLCSGGHTTEATIMLSAINAKRYHPRHYFVSEGDTLSVRKAIELEETYGAVRFHVTKDELSAHR
jgi:Oligosaccharide biosynthesis protein Alg14 like